jgi:ribose/xylose/arabinose/galactoside ABC-type transport system permease subunit
MYGFSSIVVAWLVTGAGLDLWTAAAITLVVGMVIGLVNGGVTAIIGVPSFIVTLGMLSALRGASLVISGAFPIPLPFRMHSSLFSIAGGTVGIIPAQVLWMVGVVIVGAAILRFTVFGYHVYATGGNQRAASQAGINTVRVKLTCFVLTGFLAALVGVLEVGWLKDASPDTGTGFELQVIGAVIIGGTALFGGEGSVFGTLVGASILAMLADGLILLGLSTDAFLIFTGLIIGGAAVLDVVLRRKDIRILNPIGLLPGFATRVAATSPADGERPQGEE